MRKKLIFVIALLSLTACNSMGQFGEIDCDSVETLKCEAINRNGVITDPYPDIANLEQLPVFKVTGMKTEGGDIQIQNIMDELGVNLDFRNPNDLKFQYKGELYNKSCIYNIDNGVRCIDSSVDGETLNLVFDCSGDKNNLYFANYRFRGLDKIVEFSATDSRNSDGEIFKKLDVYLPQDVLLINYEYNNDNGYCEINENQESIIFKFFKDYINNHKSVFPFEVKKAYIENCIGFPYKVEDNNIYGECFTNVFFYENGSANSADVLLGYYGFVDRIIASYSVDNFDSEELHSIKFVIEEDFLSYEQVAECKIISLKEAEICFEQDKSVYYSKNADSEIIKDYDIYLVYCIDSKGYARPVYVKQAKGNIGNFNADCGWIDAIKW